MRAEIDALFGDFKDAYTELTPPSETVLAESDTALVLTKEGNLQLFIPDDGDVSDRGLALIEIYNAMCRDRVGTVTKEGHPIPENEPYKGFTQSFIDIMKARVPDNATG